MALTILGSGRGSDSGSDYAEAQAFLRKRYGERGRLETCKGITRFGLLYTSWLIAKREDGPVIIDHPLRDGDLITKAELEWWQQSHQIVGWGWALNKAGAVDQALACSRRGKLEQMRLEAWLNRATRQFEVYECSPRYQPRGEDDIDNIRIWYRPTGRRLEREQLAHFAGAPSPGH
jgi:hypothetical protein